MADLPRSAGFSPHSDPGLQSGNRAMLAGLALLGAAYGLQTWSMGFGFWWLVDGGRLIKFLVVATLAAAAFARRPAWAASLTASVVGTLAGLAFMGANWEAAATPWGDSLVPKDYARQMPAAYRPIIAAGEADLALLRRGAEAAREGRPLPAPEGGVLVPQEREDARGVVARWRYPAAPSVTPAVWEAALRKQEAVLAGDREAATMAPTNRPTAWLVTGAFLGGGSLALALVANLVALASRRLSGARP